MKTMPARLQLSGKAKLVFPILPLALILCAVAGAPARAQEEGFTAEERRSLEAGRLVTRPTQARRGQRLMIGGNSWQVVDRGPRQVWAALNDVRAYPQLLPNTESARVVAGSGASRVVRLRHEVGLVTARYHLRMRFDEGRHDVAFQLDPQRPNDIRAAWGFLQVQAYDGDPDRSLISFGVMMDPGSGFLSGLVRGPVHRQMLRVPRSIRRFMHGAGGARY